MGIAPALNYMITGRGQSGNDSDHISEAAAAGYALVLYVNRPFLVGNFSLPPTVQVVFDAEGVE
jgi:hypothetical protein